MVYINGGSASFSECTLSNNQVKEMGYHGGGVVYVSGGSASFSQCTLSNNRAIESNGAVFYISQQGTVTMSACSVTNNIASGWAGVPYGANSAFFIDPHNSDEDATAVLVNKIFGIHRYFKISRGRNEFFIRIVAESRAFQFCKEREREEKMALSWEKISLTFWAEKQKLSPEEDQ